MSLRAVSGLLLIGGNPQPMYHKHHADVDDDDDDDDDDDQDDDDDDDDGPPCSQIFAYPPLPEKLF